jgi:hypothetical protein
MNRDSPGLTCPTNNPARDAISVWGPELTVLISSFTYISALEETNPVTPIFGNISWPAPRVFLDSSNPQGLARQDVMMKRGCRVIPVLGAMPSFPGHNIPNRMKKMMGIFRSPTSLPAGRVPVTVRGQGLPRLSREPSHAMSPASFAGKKGSDHFRTPAAWLSPIDPLPPRSSPLFREGGSLSGMQPPKGQNTGLCPTINNCE